jgi:hypothetical protein
LRKQTKSETFRTGGAELPSQLAKASAAAKWFMKQRKSETLRAGGRTEPSQLA